jgi:hypothetical protein
VPPRGFEPLPSIFGESRPIRGTVANTGVLPHRQRSPWPRLHSAAWCVTRERSRHDRKCRRVEQTTSTTPASVGSAALNPLDSSGHDQLGRRFSVHLGMPRRACAGSTLPAQVRCRCRPARDQSLGCLVWHRHRRRLSCQRSHARRAQRAPRASMHSRSARAHLSRPRSRWELRSRVAKQIVVMPDTGTAEINDPKRRRATRSSWAALPYEVMVSHYVRRGLRTCPHHGRRPRREPDGTAAVAFRRLRSPVVACCVVA